MNSKILLIIISIILVSGCEKTANIQDVETNELSIQNENKNFCESHYGGTSFDGFCFTDKSKIIFTDAQNGEYKYTPTQSNIERTIKYPRSIELIDGGVNFDMEFFFTNKGQSSESLTLHNFKITLESLTDMKIDINENLMPGETKHLKINVDLPKSAFNFNSMTEIDYVDKHGEFDDGLVLSRILLYWTKDFHQLLPAVVKDCAGRKYTESFGTCIDGIYYPAIGLRSCQSDADCVSKYPYLGDSSCMEYSCIGHPDLIGPINRNYRVGILPVYVTDTSSGYTLIKQATDVRLTKIIPLLTKWISDETSYWNVPNFGFKFSAINNECKMTSDEFRQIHPVDGVAMTKPELALIKNRCASQDDNDILIMSIVRESNFDPQFNAGGGSNSLELIAATLQPYVIFHELFHSFGATDIYITQTPQFDNCYLYTINSYEYWDQYMPHLCRMEAKLIGFIPEN